MRILAFVINADYREKVLGTILLISSIQHAHSLNCKAITLNSGNRLERENAHSFYKKQGFLNRTLGFTKNL